MKETKTDKQQAGASYIISFYNNIEALNDTFSQYLCILLDYQNQYPNAEKADDAAKTEIKQYMQNVRFVMNKAYIQYKTIAQSLKIKESKTISDIYNQTKEKFLIPQDIIEKFVIEINTILVNNVIQELLETSKSTIQSLVDDGRNYTQ